MIHYRAYGKQVKRDAQHVADAADETWAQIIADALNGERNPAAGVTRMLAERYGSEALDHNALNEARVECSHLVTRQGDEYACLCGRRWDRDEGDACPGAS